MAGLQQCAVQHVGEPAALPPEEVHRAIQFGNLSLERRDDPVWRRNTGTSIIGRIPYSDWIGVYLSTHGRHYRPAAAHLVQIISTHIADAVVVA